MDHLYLIVDLILTELLLFDVFDLESGAVIEDNFLFVGKGTGIGHPVVVLPVPSDFVEDSSLVWVFAVE